MLLFFEVTDRLPAVDNHFILGRLPPSAFEITATMPNRTVFFVSDGTGITAETFGNAILAQFNMKPRHVRLPFTDTIDKAHQAVRQINHTAETEGVKPIVFTTLVNMDVLKVLQDQCKGMMLDMFAPL